ERRTLRQPTNSGPLALLSLRASRLNDRTSVFRGDEERVGLFVVFAPAFTPLKNFARLGRLLGDFLLSNTRRPLASTRRRRRHSAGFHLFTASRRLYIRIIFNVGSFRFVTGTNALSINETRRVLQVLEGPNQPLQCCLPSPHLIIMHA